MIRKGPNSTMTDVSDYIVDLQGVTFRRGQRVIFDGVEIRSPRGTVTGIRGPSGCGKPTLLRLIGAQLRPESGSIWVTGRNSPELGREQLFDLQADPDERRDLHDDPAHQEVLTSLRQQLQRWRRECNDPDR